MRLASAQDTHIDLIFASCSLARRGPAKLHDALSITRTTARYDRTTRLAASFKRYSSGWVADSINGLCLEHAAVSTTVAAASSIQSRRRTSSSSMRVVANSRAQPTSAQEIAVHWWI